MSQALVYPGVHSCSSAACDRHKSDAGLRDKMAADAAEWAPRLTDGVSADVPSERGAHVNMIDVSHLFSFFRLTCRKLGSSRSN